MAPRNSHSGSHRGAGRWLPGTAKVTLKISLMFAVLLATTVLLSPAPVLAVDVATLNEINALKERLSRLEAKIAADSARAERAETTAAPVATAEEESSLREMVTEVVNSSKPDIRIGARSASITAIRTGPKPRKIKGAILPSIPFVSISTVPSRI